MKVNQRLRPISAIVALRPDINLNPAWQRGPVWSPQKQVLLIDSVLREMDLPKIYLLQCGQGAPYNFEVVDGQQRLRAIFLFRNGELALSGKDDIAPIDGEEVDGKTFEELSDTLRGRFDDFEISVGEIEPTDHDSVRRLFLRLQMGEALNPAELRNAMPGPLRHMVDLLATTSPFFGSCGIPDKRYKRQDYLAHVFTLLAADGATTLKAPNIKAAYEDMEVETIETLAPIISDALDILEEVNGLADYRMTQKWIFIDLCWYVSEKIATGATVDAQQIAQSYSQFERRRREYTQEPEQLLRSRRSAADRALYNYIIAFKTSGADRNNVAARQTALETILSRLGGAH